MLGMQRAGLTDQLFRENRKRNSRFLDLGLLSHELNCTNFLKKREREREKK